MKSITSAEVQHHRSVYGEPPEGEVRAGVCLNQAAVKDMIARQKAQSRASDRARTASPRIRSRSHFGETTYGSDYLQWGEELGRTADIKGPQSFYAGRREVNSVLGARGEEEDGTEELGDFFTLFLLHFW